MWNWVCWCDQFDPCRLAEIRVAVEVYLPAIAMLRRLKWPSLLLELPLSSAHQSALARDQSNHCEIVLSEFASAVVFPAKGYSGRSAS